MEMLRTFQEVTHDLAAQYQIPEEIVEAILIEWARILYMAMTGREPDDLGALRGL